MKTIFNDFRKIFTMTILIASIATLAVGYVPSALAMNTPNVSSDPATTVLGGTSVIKITADASTLNHDRSTLGMYDPDNTLALNANTIGGSGNCRTGLASGPGVHWELRHLDGTTPLVFTMSAVGDTFKVKFGTDAGVPITDKTAGTTVSSMNVKWIDTSGGSDPAKYDILTNPLDPFDSYTVRACGFENVITIGSPTGGLYNAESQVFVAEPIGGEILAINSAALLIAGLTTSAIWMIPAVGAVAGTAVTLYKLRQKQ